MDEEERERMACTLIGRFVCGDQWLRRLQPIQVSDCNLSSGLIKVDEWGEEKREKNSNNNNNKWFESLVVVFFVRSRGIFSSLFLLLHSPLIFSVSEWL